MIAFTVFLLVVTLRYFILSFNIVWYSFLYFFAVQSKSYLFCWRSAFSLTACSDPGIVFNTLHRSPANSSDDDNNSSSSSSHLTGAAGSGDIEMAGYGVSTSTSVSTSASTGRRISGPGHHQAQGHAYQVMAHTGDGGESMGDDTFVESHHIATGGGSGDGEEECCADDECTHAGREGTGYLLDLEGGSGVGGGGSRSPSSSSLSAAAAAGTGYGRGSGRGSGALEGVRDGEAGESDADRFEGILGAAGGAGGVGSNNIGISNRNLAAVARASLGIVGSGSAGPGNGAGTSAAAAIRPTYAPLPTMIECGRCELMRPRDASHCHDCGVCVRKLDHHCPVSV
jgi:hypothetical protein